MKRYWLTGMVGMVLAWVVAGNGQWPGAKSTNTAGGRARVEWTNEVHQLEMKMQAQWIRFRSEQRLDTFLLESGRIGWEQFIVRRDGRNGQTRRLRGQLAALKGPGKK